MSVDLENYTTDAILKDGRTVHIRPIMPADGEKVWQLWLRLSPETIRLRFLGSRRLSREEIPYYTHLDMRDRFALVAEIGERIVGVSRFDRLPAHPDTAEFAVLVEDAEQGRGIGTALMRALVPAAEDLGITRFEGDVLRDNEKMLHVLRSAGLEPAYQGEDGVLHTAFTTIPTERFLAAGDEHDQQAAVAALSAVLAPDAIAVVGASRDPQSIGGLVFGNLLRGGFNGPVYPVNPNAAYVQSVATYKTLSDCPTVPEMVLVCVPAPLVREVVEEAGRLGTKAVVIISSGFAETDGEGPQRERAVMATARSYGVRVVGPNCMGVLNAKADVRMNGTFSRAFPSPGQVGFLSQSGALGLAILSSANQLGLGFTTFGSVGNKADLSGNDFLQYWEGDPDTEVILLYLESFGNPRKFGRLARRISRTKPIVAVKSGRSSAGERAASSHTGALAAGDVAVDALFRQAGVLRVDTLEEMFNVATVLANQPVPQGRGVGILTNGGGPGILAADACEAHGLKVPELEPATVARLREFLPPEAGIRNPVDAIASASANDYGRAMRVLAQDPSIHALLVIFIPPMVTRPEDVAREMAAAQREIGEAMPVLGVFMQDENLPEELHAARIPTFAFPEDAAKALGHVAWYGDWRSRPLGNVVEVDDADVNVARAVVEEALPAGVDEAWLSAGQNGRLLSAFGIPIARSQVVYSGEEAAAFQTELGVPVAVKTAAPVHKTELGGLRLDLNTGEKAAEAVDQIRLALEEAGRQDLVEHGFLVQEMIGDGVEMAIGVSYDPTFGPLLMTGMGGTLVELLKDVSVRIHPLTDVDVEEMLTQLRGYPLLAGYRGSKRVDLEAFKALLFRVSALVEAVPEIDEVDLNPVFARQHGAAVVDARVKLARHQRIRRR